MSNQIPISFFSGNRADLGPLWPVINEATANQHFSTSLIVSSCHKPDAIANCRIHAYEDNCLGDDELAACQKSGIALGNIGKAIDELRPKCLVILGDRFEALSAAQSAVIFKVPIAHICGGDTSKGSFDQHFRNAISIMADLHFTTNKKSTENLKSMGIQPKKIYEFGHPGIDSILKEPILSRETFFKAIGLNSNLKTILVSFHSVTAKKDLGKSEFDQFLCAIHEIIQHNSKVQFLATGANTDPFGTQINKTFKNFEKQTSKFLFVHTLGTGLFKNALIHCDLFIGNSSSIIYEAPAIGQHALLIGDRQSYRAMPHVVNQVPANTSDIVTGIIHALNSRKPQTNIFFGRPGVSKKIINKLVETYRDS